MSKCWYCDEEIKSGDKVEIIHKDCFNKIADLEAKLAESNEQLEMAWDDFHRMQNEKIKVQHQLAESEKQRQELNDVYEDLLCAKGTEHELKQAKEDVEMLDERRLCLFSLLYETLEKQGCENITSTIEQMTNLHLNKCSHWYKNNRVCDELKQQLAEKEQTISNLIEDSKASKDLLKKEIENLNKEFVQAIHDWKEIIKKKDEELQHFKVTIGTMENNQVDISSTTYAEQDKISFAVEQLEKLKIELHYLHTDRYLKLIDEEIDNQIEELKRR